ncbi:hypothetical protein ACFV2V_01905 [Streptomyces sp. NPDC059698]|uniref:hypothetical protein n=1 Tax=unclassified Streptomyces TaxID=2593676 RepID=UPI00093FADE2|nr:hypothetical protein [Streptomyces sp. CB02366]OKJ35404.1 hypothetical protein AMK24_19665 [Streptomyces sp. CB02366]TVP34024.1 hypothetical protein A3L22_15130 [Streptomyces griseus subsp. griseus]WSS58697.1 hypothetical protein OG543_26595 [Streptomyces sp. NBC_01178]
MTARTRRLGGWAVLLVAALVCGLGAWSYGQARGDGSLSYAKARDTALAEGRRHLATLNSLDGADAKRVDTGLRAWLDASTGPLHDQLERTRKADAKSLKTAGDTARGKVTSAALTALDERTGTAELIAAVDVEVTPRSGAAGIQRKRFGATLARTADGWKVKALTAIGTDGGR